MNEPVILQLGAPQLRQIASAVIDFDSASFHDTLKTLQQHMQTANGVGIAAPQLGIGQQIIIVASRPTPRYPQAPLMTATVLCNPRFEITDPTLIKDWEGCLSVPGIRAQVPRYRAIRVYFQDIQGVPQQLELEDFPARVFQHEFDHLQGLVYLDRIETTADIIAESEYLKRIAC